MTSGKFILEISLIRLYNYNRTLWSASISSIFTSYFKQILILLRLSRHEHYRLPVIRVVLGTYPNSDLGSEMGSITLVSSVRNETAKTANRVDLIGMVNIIDRGIFDFDCGLIENHVVVIYLEHFL